MGTTSFFSAGFKHKALALSEKIGTIQAADKLNISANTLAQWRAEYARSGALKASRARGRVVYTKAQKEKAIRLFRELGDVTAVADAVGMPRKTLYNWLYRNNGRGLIPVRGDDDALLQEKAETQPQPADESEMERIAHALERISLVLENGVKFL